MHDLTKAFERRRRALPNKHHLIEDLVLLCPLVCPDCLAKIRDVIDSETAIKTKKVM